MIDSSTPLWPDALPVPMLRRQHRHFPRPDVVQMETGRIRRRRVQEQSIELMDVQWLFVEDQFEGFELFFRDQLRSGSLSFVLTTLLSAEGLDNESMDVVVREVAFWEGSYSFSRSDNLFAVSAVLEVLQVVQDDPGPSYISASYSAAPYYDGPQLVRLDWILGAVVVTVPSGIAWDSMEYEGVNPVIGGGVNWQGPADVRSIP